MGDDFGKFVPLRFPGFDFCFGCTRGCGPSLFGTTQSFNVAVALRIDSTTHLPGIVIRITGR